MGILAEADLKLDAATRLHRPDHTPALSSPTSNATQSDSASSWP